MKSAVIVFPGSNRERDIIYALKQVTGSDPVELWHQDNEIPNVELVVLPGGFSYGDYLRSGAIAARSPIMTELVAKAREGLHVLGICNGFQILTEIGLLPGALMRNASLNFVCREVKLRTENNQTAYTSAFGKKVVWRCPVAHHDGNYYADPDVISELEDSERVVFRYAEGTNPNGSINDIAGIVNSHGNVLGMMPHPENLIEEVQGGIDGRVLFESLMAKFAL